MSKSVALQYRCLNNKTDVVVVIADLLLRKQLLMKLKLLLMLLLLMLPKPVTWLKLWLKLKMLKVGPEKPKYGVSRLAMSNCSYD